MERELRSVARIKIFSRGDNRGIKDSRRARINQALVDPLLRILRSRILSDRDAPRDIRAVLGNAQEPLLRPSPRSSPRSKYGIVEFIK